MWGESRILNILAALRHKPRGCPLNRRITNVDWDVRIEGDHKVVTDEPLHTFDPGARGPRERHERV